MFASRDPRYDQFKCLIGSIVTIEGIIGVGKSTTGYSLEKYLNESGLKAKFFPEYVNLELLNQYIGDMKRYAYAFQVIMLMKRIEIYKEAERFSASGGISLIDRSIIGDMTFARMQKDNGNFTDAEWNIYISLMQQDIQLTPSVSLYLQCTPETSLDRVKVRGIKSEVEGYSSEYMQRLHQAYEETIHECTNVTHIVIDWNLPHILEGNYLDNAAIEYLLNRIIARS